MVYLDYSATTPVNEEVLESFNTVTRNYIGNANSIHKLGLKSRKLMEKATSNIASYLGVNSNEVIFTSSASEANNMVLKGVLESYKNRGCHIITTKLEHSSILDTCCYLEKNGIDVSYVEVNEEGIISYEDLEKLIRPDTVLISIHQVNSEIGLVQDVASIAKRLKKEYPKIFFHVDGTQSIGKIFVSLDDIDLFTFSSHKIFGLKGIACLIKKYNVNITPLIHGGKSQSQFRSGTPAVALMVSFAKALRMSLENIEEKYKYVGKLNEYLKEELKKIEGVVINSTSTSIPHILNISLLDIKPEVMLHALEQEEIYISTKTACSKDSGASICLLALGKDEKVASTSLRISISYITTKEEIDYFLKIFKIKYQTLLLKKGK